ncbi:hypothetical protein D9M72_292740 [compost metagenome]
MAKRASASGWPAIQPATSVSASSQALMFTNCSITPCPKPTERRALSALPSWALPLSL